MQSDEQEIRQLVSTWMAATREGDVDTVLSLMTDDAVFLTPGRAPMRKSDFAALSRAQVGPNAPKFDGTNEVQEIRVFGEWAYMWQRLTVVGTAPNEAPVRREGHTLTIFRKSGVRWLLSRDANMLARVDA